MAASLLLLLDDIASVLDDVATMTKVAVKKTAGVIGDDLALNAKQVAGVATARELPVVWAVARGSALNKVILVPAALAFDWLAPWAVPPLLLLGGLYLCYEGAEKILHRFLGGHAADHHPHGSHAPGDHEALERSRIAGAIRTDFILSAEIVVITLGVVATSRPATKAAVLVAIAVAMTVGVYGLVAAIVKLDDLGAWLAARPGAGARRLGLAILAAAPGLMRLLSIAGTAAMFLVGGGIVAHAMPWLHHAVHAVTEVIAAHAPGWIETVATAVAEAGVGLVAGSLAVGLIQVTRALRRPAASA